MAGHIVAVKIHDYRPDCTDGVHVYVFHCPGCGHDHPFHVGPTGVSGHPEARWSWNGSFDSPTFAPSLLCNKDFPESRCHSFVRDGRIKFQKDCWHALREQTVDLPDWED